ncbi:hypothetical protein PybrP1_012342 [[Pythium] brassicae (nom. inval.)]|nr:hypothetical protein PybrP1_012342 [[Pythium] brassicae (nom. inval.)]
MEKLFELFLFYALQNISGKTLQVTSYQFKSLLQRAVSSRPSSGGCSPSFPSTTLTKECHVPSGAKRKSAQRAGFDTRVLLAFRGAVAHSGTGAGANFDEFLDALVDVAGILFPKAASRAIAFEVLATEIVIPHFERLQYVGGASALSWLQMDALLTKPGVLALVQRFAKVVGDLAASYSSTVGSSRACRGLQFYELGKFMHDLKLKSLAVNSSELCDVFIRCCRAELRAQYSDTATLASLYFLSSSSVSTSGTGVQGATSLHGASRSSSRTSSAGGNFTTHGGGGGSDRGNAMAEMGGALEILCSKVMRVFGYVALMKAPPLAKMKDGLQSADFTSLRLDKSSSGTLAVVSLKALLQHIANHLSGKSATQQHHQQYHYRHPTKHSAAFELASVQFLHEFQKLHLEDDMADYLSDLSSEIRTLGSNDGTKHECAARSAGDAQSVGESYSDPALNKLNGDDDFNCGSHGQGADSEVDSESDSVESDWESARDTSVVAPIDPQVLQAMRLRELDELSDELNEGDEIYSFLASELQRCAVLGRCVDDADLVAQMLDMWVAAGQNFVQRFASSLFVFACQLLNSTTRVYAYEAIFSVTNARVYGVSAECWDDTGSVFTKDLAMETLSLASAKFSSASEAFLGLLEQSSSEEDERSNGAASSSASELYGKYIECLFLRASCLSAYGDIVAHDKACERDYELGCLVEDELERLHIGASADPSSARYAAYRSELMLSQASTPGQFYCEANRVLRFVQDHAQPSAAATSRTPQAHKVHLTRAMTQFKLATHLPRGCVAEKKLLEEALVHLTLCQKSDSMRAEEADALADKKEYISAILVLRQRFFQPEGPTAFKDFDPDNSGVLTLAQLSKLNGACERGSVAAPTMQWLLCNFDSQGEGLTEKGLLQYFCWIAEADPVAFCAILDIFTSKYTETHHASITTSRPAHIAKEPKAKSLRSIVRFPAPSRDPRLPVRLLVLCMALTLCHECVVVLSGKMTRESCGDLSSTTSPAGIRLEPEVVDVLPSSARFPDELSKFCYPDDVVLCDELLPPRAFDIVLTDMKGERLYGSCFHFYEEKEPMEVLALISGMQKGKTASLPSWISLRDIQQHKTRWRCFVPKCLCVLSSHPLFQTFRAFLAQLYRLSVSAPSSSAIEAFVLNLLAEIPLPGSNFVQTSFSLVDKACLLTGCTPGLPAFYPTEVDFTLLFQSLSPENVVRVYALLLTEKKLVVCSENLSVLTPVMETLRALLHPFECQVVYIPVLPLSLLDFVSAPVPFFMGVCSDPRVERLPADGIAVVDLDKNEVLLPPSELMPSLPDVKAKKLLQALRKAAAWAAGHKTKEHYGQFKAGELAAIASFEDPRRVESEVAQLARSHDDLLDKWGELQTLFTGFATRLLKDVRKHCSKTTSPKDPSESVAFDKRGYLSMHPSAREFCTQLFQTQLFQRFIDQSSLDRGFVSSGEQENSWLSAKSMSVIWKFEPAEEPTKAPPRQLLRAPSPFARQEPAALLTKRSLSQRRASLNTIDAFPTFHAHIYDELLAQSSAATESPPPSDKAKSSWETPPSPTSALGKGASPLVGDSPAATLSATHNNSEA